MQIIFSFNVRHTKSGLEQESQEEAEYDEPPTIQAIHDAIVANGHKCVDVEANEEVYEIFKRLRPKTDLVFNIAEGLRGEMREAQIPAMLEMLGIPYTHSGALAQAVSLDKSLTKKIWQYHGLPTPRFVSVAKNEKPYVEGLRFPVIVKPNSEGSSKGIFNDNLISDPKKLLEKIRATRKQFGNGVIIEEYLPGREFTVTVMGNPGIGKGVYILPIVEQNYNVFPQDLRRFASYEAKWLFEDTLADPHVAYTCPAKISAKFQKEIELLCIKAFTVLNCRDVARVDLRLDADGKPSLLEINPLPGMIPGQNVVSYFPVAARAKGWDYKEMVGRIIRHAQERLAA